MRKIKVLSLLACCLATAFMSSCLGDDEDVSGLTPEQMGQCLNAIKGRYTGEMIYASTNPDNASDKTDTLQISWTVLATDTTLALYNFPVERIASGIDNQEVAEALADAMPADVISKLYFFNNSPISFMMYPGPVTYKVNYGGEEHKVTAYFYAGNYSFGQHSATAKQMRMQMILGGVYFDDDLKTNHLKENQVFIFNSKW